jgi:hypothetical protein
VWREGSEWTLEKARGRPQKIRERKGRQSGLSPFQGSSERKATCVMLTRLQSTYYDRDRARDRRNDGVDLGSGAICLSELRVAPH